MTTRRLILFTLSCLTVASPSFAQLRTTWYAGGGVGNVHTRFEPDYTFVLNGGRQTFLNEADGLQLDLVVGRRYQLGNRFWLGYQGTVNANRVEWTLFLPDEPADFHYSLPYAVLATVVPEVRLADAVFLFGEVGGGTGRVRQIKASPNASNYDIDHMRGATAIGGGVRVRASARTMAFVGFRRVSYSQFEFDTFNPAGVQIERVHDAPRATGFTAGFVVTF